MGPKPEWLPEIPDALLPRPRVIVWHGPVESEEDGRPLEVLRRAHHAVIGHGFVEGTSAGGDDWSGWSFTGEGATGYVDGLAHSAYALARPWWRVIHEDPAPDPNRRCATGCGQLVAPGDVYCPDCASARDRSGWAGS
jgi:hypothetical protein